MLLINKRKVEVVVCLLLLFVMATAVACNGDGSVGGLTGPADSSAEANAERPFPLPRHDLLLLCDEAGSEAHSLMRYDLGRDEWGRVLDGRHFSQMFALPQQQDVMLLELPEDEDAHRAILWREGEEQFLFDTASFTTQGQTDPGGQWLVVYEQRPFAANPPALLDLNRCRQGECTPTPLAGEPTWSGDGQWTLLNDTTNPSDGDTPHGLLLGNAQGEVVRQLSPRSVGSSLFWLDEETYGYFRPPLEFEAAPDVTAANPAEVVIASVAADSPTVLLKADAVWPLQPDENFPLSFYMEAAAVPADADRLLLLAVAYDPEDVSPSGPGLTAGRPGLTAGKIRTQLWRLERSSAELSLLLQADILSAPRFSPDGRWLWLGGYLLEMQDDPGAVPQIKASLHLFDLQNGWQHSRIDTFAGTISGFQSSRAAAWSADGQWLFIAGDDRLQIVAPADNQHLTLPLPAAGCRQVVWDGESGS
jgi:hypothetical protein